MKMRILVTQIKVKWKKNPMVRRSSRERQPSTRLRDNVTYSVQYPVENFVSYDNISTEYHTFLTNVEK